MTSIDLPERPRILVVTLRRLGDVLLTTPLVRTIRRGFPHGRLDILVFRGSERILKGNPDIDNVISIPERPSAGETLALVRQLWRRYDLAVTTQAGDRPTFYAVVAGRRRVGLIPYAGETGAWWKRHAHHIAVAAEPDRHRVTQLLTLASALGLDHEPDIVCPQGSSAAEVAPPGPYAVVHANPFYRYKRWNDLGWRGLASGLAQRGLAVVATEGRDPAERAYVDGLWEARRPARHPRARAPGLGRADSAPAGCRGLCRTRYVHDASRGGQWLSDHRTLRADEPAADRSLARWRPRRAVGSRRHGSAARECLGGAEPATLPAMRKARM